MKFLAIIGVFAIFTGSLVSGAPRQTLTVGKLIDILLGLPMIALPISSRIGRSKTGPILSEVYENVSHSLWNIWEELPSDVRDTLVQGSKVFEGILKKGHRAINDLHRKADVGQPLKEVMSYYGDPVLEKLEPYLMAFESTLDTVLKQIVDEVLVEYANLLDDELYRDLKQLKDVQPTLQGFADQVMIRLRQGAEALHKNLKPRLKPILEEIEKYKTEFWVWVDTPIYPPDP